jgi:co-chaperonin GroES (HSP10)
MKKSPNLLATLAPKLYTPTHDKLVIQITKVTESAGGIAMSDNAPIGATPEKYPHQVVAVGPECKYVKRGDLILMGENQPILNVKYGGHQTYVVLHEEEIAGVVDEPQTNKDRRLLESAEKYDRYQSYGDASDA